MRPGRLVAAGWYYTLKSQAVSGFFLLMTVIQPAIFASIAFFLFRSGRGEGTLLYAALGAGLMGIWSSTLFGAGTAIQWQRWLGTLEALVAAPAPFVLVLLPMALAAATTGLYALVTTLLVGRVLFGVPLSMAHPFLFALAIPVTVLALGLLGLFMASSFVLYRHANALANLLEYPVWLVTGLLVPVSLLPGFVAPISWLLAPTWGVRALRHAALGGDPLPEIGMCVGLGAAYFVLAVVFLAVFERQARDRATLSLT